MLAKIWLMIELIVSRLLLKKDRIYLFLESGEGREKEREGNINVWLPLVRPQQGTWPPTQACALTGNVLATLRHSIHGATPAKARPLFKQSERDKSLGFTS